MYTVYKYMYIIIVPILKQLLYIVLDLIKCIPSNCEQKRHQLGQTKKPKLVPSWPGTELKGIPRDAAALGRWRLVGGVRVEVCIMSSWCIGVALTMVGQIGTTENLNAAQVLAGDLGATRDLQIYVLLGKDFVWFKYIFIWCHLLNLVQDVPHIYIYIYTFS